MSLKSPKKRFALRIGLAGVVIVVGYIGLWIISTTLPFPPELPRTQEDWNALLKKEEAFKKGKSPGELLLAQQERATREQLKSTIRGIARPFLLASAWFNYRFHKKSPLLPPSSDQAIQETDRFIEQSQKEIQEWLKKHPAAHDTALEGEEITIPEPAPDTPEETGYRKYQDKDGHWKSINLKPSSELIAPTSTPSAND